MQIETLDLTVDDVTDIQWEDAAELLGQETPRHVAPVDTDSEGTSGACLWCECTGGC